MYNCMTSGPNMNGATKEHDWFFATYQRRHSCSNIIDRRHSLDRMSVAKYITCDNNFFLLKVRNWSQCRPGSLAVTFLDPDALEEAQKEGGSVLDVSSNTNSLAHARVHACIFVRT